ncbi:MAG TPA: hypothetical protein PLP20_06155 [Oscillospiraceae bacterium]|nr:hypothetical protein [Oscillospiraceae bacterium]HNW05024.1 hypothetical protein [Oscillospiraceae bacterium]HPW00620.1 hypothetical protein [Oscillospiraceae bacterium]
MRWFQSILPPKPDAPRPPDGMSAEEEKQWRVSQLTAEERKAFEWFKLGYTARWTAETMLLDRKTAGRLFACVYRKLCVADAPEVCRVYRMVTLTPRELPSEDTL